jgi:hypothetical protein
MQILLESALVIEVPEADPLVAPFRNLYDPAAAQGVPAHITLLYPFKPPLEIADPQLARLRHCLVRFTAFQYSLAEVKRFPQPVLYLAPEPVEPFRQMTVSLWECFPETPPYGGKHSEILPHLTLGQFTDEGQLEETAAAFARAAEGKLPIRATASQVSLMDTRSGRWRVSSTFPLR